MQTEVSYSNAPIIMGPSMMQPQATRAPPGQGFGAKPAIPGMVSGTGGFSPGPRSIPGSPVLLGNMNSTGSGLIVTGLWEVVCVASG